MHPLALISPQLVWLQLDVRALLLVVNPGLEHRSLALVATSAHLASPIRQLDEPPSSPLWSSL